MTRRLKHIGVSQFFAEKKEILDEFDSAKSKLADKQVKTTHGIIGEALIRKWLRSFLPKRFGVCKGYIISTNLEYEGFLEEWDIIIYDALESPILFTEGSSDNSEDKIRAIPVEYVRGVIEVKASFNPKSTTEVVKKLEKLTCFIGTNTSNEFPQYFRLPFISTAIFFETSVKTLKEYKKSLNNLAKIYQIQPSIRFMGSLILRSQREKNHSGYLQVRRMKELINFPDDLEMSSTFSFTDGNYGAFGCLCYSVNSYPQFIFDLLAYIKGISFKGSSSFYGDDFENVQASRLFH